MAGCDGHHNSGGIGPRSKSKNLEGAQKGVAGRTGRVARVGRHLAVELSAARAGYRKALGTSDPRRDEAPTRTDKR
jgi:hypothetical protein